MKKLTGLLCAMLFIAPAFGGTPVEKEVPVDHVYAPMGFDSNDNVEIVVAGSLPNLCHRAPKTSVTFIGDTVHVRLTSLYYDTSNPFCPEVTVPFTEAVNLGVLDKGQYKIVVNGGNLPNAKGNLFVAESQSDAVDSHVYADVEFVEKSLGSRVVQLKGYNPSDCFELKKIDYITNNKDTYSVLPILKQVDDFCPMKMVPFSYEFEVPTDLKEDKVLLHVRSMEGKSINSVYDQRQ